MAIEQLIAKGDKYVKENDFLSAISAYTNALKENPEAFQPYIKRSTAYVRLNNLEAAIKDISSAFTIADNRGRRNDKGLCYFKLGLINYKQKEYRSAKVNFNNAKDHECSENTLPIWMDKLDYEIKKNPEILKPDQESQDELTKAFTELDSSIETKEPKSTSKSATSPLAEKTESLSSPSQAKGNPVQQSSDSSKNALASTSIDVINRQAPLKIKIRDDWYQSNDSVIVTIYAKNVKENTLNINFDKKSVSVSFPSGAGSEYSYNLDPLYDEIITDKSAYKIYGTKLELNLAKSKQIKWPSLEGSSNSSGAELAAKASTKSDSKIEEISTNKNPALTYPSSSKKAINWDKFNADDPDAAEADEGDFFAKLYKDVDDDTRRAMMKSYVESNGTVLTTNWNEAKEKKFETSPPEGMSAKEWNERPNKK